MEFEDLMAHLVRHARALHALVPGGLAAPLFSWDNNKIQKSADLTRMGITAAEHLPLSTYSPDMHKVIEHAWNQIKFRVQRRLLQLGGAALTAQQAQDMVEEEVRATSCSGILKDVSSLIWTYFVIASEKGVVLKAPDGAYHTGTGGDWPPAQYR